MEPIVYKEIDGGVLLLVDSTLDLPDIARHLGESGTEITAYWRWQAAIPGRHKIEFVVADKIDPGKPIAESHVHGTTITYTIQPVGIEDALSALTDAFSMRTISPGDRPSPVDPVSVS